MSEHRFNDFSLGHEVLVPEANLERAPEEQLENTEVVLTPEAIATIHGKREMLLSGDRVSFRFVNRREYQETLQAGCAPRNLEANSGLSMEDVYQMSGFDPASLKVMRGHSIPGYYSLIWKAIAYRFTDWPHSYQDLSSPADNLAQYQKMWKERDENQSRATIRESFVTLVQEKVTDYLLGVSKDRQRLDGLIESSSYIADEDRDILRRALEKHADEIDGTELRVLLRYAVDNAESKMYKRNVDRQHSYANSGADIPYELVEIWDTLCLTEYPTPAAWKSIKAGSSVSHLLGVIPLYFDKDFIKSIETTMAQHAQENSESAHVVIGMDGRELFPFPGNDYFEKEITV